VSIGKQSDIEDATGAAAIVERIESLCGGDCTILSGGAIPEFVNGTALSEVGGSIYNHHIFGTNRNKLARTHLCPGDQTPEPKTPGIFIGGGTDQEYLIHTSADGKFKSGYELSATDKIDLVGEFMNYRPESQKINIAIDVEYLPGKPEGYLNSQTIPFSAAAACENTRFNVPTKQFSTESKEWAMPIDGYILNVRGHQHDG
jgi:hypothetical protein